MKALDLQINGRWARVWEAGSGPPLLLLHGGIGDALLHWECAAPELEHVFHMLAPCLPSYEGSDALDSPSWDTLLDWLKSILDELRLQRVPICGNSFGGAFAQVFAARYPERVSHLILVNSGPLIRLPAWLGRLASGPLGKPLQKALTKLMYSDGGLARMIAERRVLTDSFVQCARDNGPRFGTLMTAVSASKPPPLGELDIPVTVIWGDLDGVVSEQTSQKLASRYRNGTLRRVEGVGHMPQVEAPVRFAMIVRDVLGAPVPR